MTEPGSDARANHHENSDGEGRVPAGHAQSDLGHHHGHDHEHHGHEHDHHGHEHVHDGHDHDHHGHEHVHDGHEHHGHEHEHGAHEHEHHKHRRHHEGHHPESDRGHERHEHASHDAADWDARYAAAGLVWGSGPNRFVTQYTADLPPGRALDLACGEGRNAIYLAQRGWQVTGVDFSSVAISKAGQLEQSVAAPHSPVTWVCADIAEFQSGPVDLVMIVYAHLPAATRRQVLRHHCAALRTGGRLLVIGHNTRNLTEGVGGPQDPAILYTPVDLLDDLGAVAPDLLVEIAAEPLREVPGADRPAIDTVVLARRP